MTEVAHYDFSSLINAFRAVGVQPGDIVFSHANIGFFGFPAEGRDQETICKIIHEAFFDVLGESGTLVLPGFTHSACRKEAFDPLSSQGIGGVFADWFLSRTQSVRSLDPNFSVIAEGARAKELTANVSLDSFGKDSFWERLTQKKGRIVNLNLNVGFNALIHHAEWLVEAPWRMDKAFEGTVLVDEEDRTVVVNYFCQRPDHAYVDYDRFATLAEDAGLVRRAKVGRGEITSILAQDCVDFFVSSFEKDPFFLGATQKVQC